MKSSNAVKKLNALAQETRLSVFRLLVRQGPGGLPAGEIAVRLKAHPATMSHHLALLERAGLVRATRVQRNIFYAADFGGMRGLLGYLAQDCCRGLPEFTGPIAGRVAGPANPKDTKKEIAI